MNKTIKLLPIIIICLTSNFYFLSSESAYANSSCQPIYGGGPTCFSIGGLVLDTTVMNPQTSKMVNSLNINDPKYKPGSLVTFQVKLTNTTNSTFPEINVKEAFPPYVNYLTGDGNFDASTKILSFKVNNLEPNKPITYTILGRVVDADQLPGEHSISCVANQVDAEVLDPASAKSTSGFCIEKGLTPIPTKAVMQKSGFPVMPPPTISKTPATGSESLILFSLIPTGILGWFLRKKSKEQSSL